MPTKTLSKEEESSLLAEYAVLTTRYTKEDSDVITKKNIIERQKEIENILNLSKEKIGEILISKYKSQYR